LSSYRNHFAPEPIVAAAIAFTETCNFPEAWQSLILFSRNYNSAHSWLKSNSVDHLYPVLLGALKNSKGIPSKVLGEWVSSPTFSSGQEELNLIVDEIGHLNKANKTLAFYEGSSNKAGYLKLIRSFRDLTKTAGSSLTLREKQIIDKINRDLKERSQGMLARIESLQDTIQYVQIEVINGGGEDILRLSNDAPAEKPLAGTETSQKNARVGKYKWGGRNLASVLQNSPEIWIDELGLFQATIQTRCEK
jgi:hypothetical protein